MIDWMIKENASEFRIERMSKVIENTRCDHTVARKIYETINPINFCCFETFVWIVPSTNETNYQLGRRPSYSCL